MVLNSRINSLFINMSIISNSKLPQGMYSNPTGNPELQDDFQTTEVKRKLPIS